MAHQTIYERQLNYITQIIAEEKQGCYDINSLVYLHFMLFFYIIETVKSQIIYSHMNDYKRMRRHGNFQNSWLL